MTYRESGSLSRLFYWCIKKFIEQNREATFSRNEMARVFYDVFDELCEQGAIVDRYDNVEEEEK